jgi:DNA-directed RNA polymerase
LAAITRDEEAGKLVNLVPADKPADVYAKVAEITAKRVEADLTNSDAHVRMYARGWTELGITRDVAKRPVMVLCYGGTSSSRRDYIKAWLYDHVTEPKSVFGENVPRAVTYLSNVMGEVMDEVIVGPRSVMRWCRSLAAKYNELNLPINWTVPTGFPVQQSYPDMEPFVVRSRLGERFIDLQLHAHLPTLLKRRQASALAPNLIHSLDAAALMRTINACWDKGIRHFVAIHDCYGTLAADMDILAETLRDEFVKMYEGFDVFEELLSKLPDEALIDVPELPEIGNLDLNGIRKQKFFFA